MRLIEAPQHSYHSYHGITAELYLNVPSSKHKLATYVLYGQAD